MLTDEKEFPSWIGCVALKELRQGLRRGLFTIPFAVVHILAILAVLADSYNGDGIPYFDQSVLLNPLTFFKTFGTDYYCGLLWSLISGTCILIIPFIGMNMMSQELQKGNSELLMLTSLKRDRVVLEKFLAAWALCLLMLTSLLPYTLVAYWVNGMRIFVVGELICTVMMHSAVMCAFVLALSGYTRIGFRVLFFILYGTVALICLSSSFIKANLSNGIFWHYLNALIGTVAMVLFGLASAKSQLKLTHYFYDMKPTVSVVLLLTFAAPVTGFCAAITLGHVVSGGFLFMAVLAWLVDMPTKKKKALAAQKLNIPGGSELLN